MKLLRFNESLAKKTIRQVDIEDIFTIMSDNGYKVDIKLIFRKNVNFETEGNLNYIYSQEATDINDEACCKIICYKKKIMSDIDFNELIELKKELNKKISIYNSNLALTNIDISSTVEKLEFIISVNDISKRVVIHNVLNQSLSSFLSKINLDRLNKYYDLSKDFIISILNNSDIFNLQIIDDKIKFSVYDGSKVNDHMFKNIMLYDDIKRHRSDKFNDLHVSHHPEIWVFLDIVIFISEKFTTIDKNCIKKHMNWQYGTFGIEQLESSDNIVAFKLNIK